MGRLRLFEVRAMRTEGQVSRWRLLEVVVKGFSDRLEQELAYWLLWLVN
jgi:hypothetical protein